MKERESENKHHVSLWDKVRQGDEQAFGELFKIFYESLIIYGRALLSDKEQVKDCVQDVFVEIWKYRYNVSEVSSVKAYLLSSVRNKITKSWKQKGKFENIVDVNKFDFLVEFSIEDVMISDEYMMLRVKQLNQLVNALPPRQKEAIFLRYHQKLTIEQVAETMKLNYQSTKNLLHKSVQQLRKGFQVLVLLEILTIF